MSISSSTTHDGYIFICECEFWMRRACLREIFYKEHDGKRYCILHYPGKEKSEEFKKALQRKLDDKDFNFGGVWFPDNVSFENSTFSADADFEGAQFSAYASFRGAQFSAYASFRGAQFNANAFFSGAQFSAVAHFNGAQFSADADFEGAQFSAVAYFNGTQFNANANFNESQFSANAYFNGAQFSADADFSAQFNANAIFVDAQFSTDAHFNGAQFSASAVFEGAQFSAVAYFVSAQFKAIANFNGAQFSADADFRFTQFKHTNFRNVVFNANVYFQYTMFIENGPREVSANANNEPSSSDDKAAVKAEIIKVSFAGARFKDGVSFEDNSFVDHVLLSFAAAVFEKPERVTFHTVSLRPHWFVNVDSRKFNFISVSWGFLDKRDAVRKEIDALEDKQVGYLSRLLVITFRQLAVNAEENNRYEEAADFRYMAMDMKRLERWRKVDLFRLSWWYWLLSGYGERVQRAFGALLSIWLLFAVIYWTGNATWWQPRQTGRIVSESSQRDTQQSTIALPLTFPEALVYSGGVMALQKPEPLPANKRAKTFVLLETILGPVQAALLALAIRRKFMR